MSASDLLERLRSMPIGAPMEFTKIRDEIHEEHERATTTEERVTLLKIFTAVMDQVERSGLSPDDLEQLRAARLQDYRLLLVRESLIGEKVSPDILFEVTEREIAAGRMAPDDDLRQAAVEGKAAFDPSPADPLEMAEDRRSSVSGWQRALNWMRRR
jgi:hypothetical protein